MDPLSLKPALVQLFNTSLTELWLDSNLKEKIVIGKHDLECVGGVREARYREIKNGRYDAVQFYGPSWEKAFTISVLNILKSAGILDQTHGQMKSGKDFFCKHAQFEYQKRKRLGKQIHHQIRDIRSQNSQRSHNQQGYTVPTFNRFDHLNY